MHRGNIIRQDAGRKQAIAQVCAFSSPEFEVNQRYRDFAIYRQ
jgi:hypothetical protein